MSSPFMYRATVTSSKGNKETKVNSIPIYAFKSGGANSPWFTGEVYFLSILQGILAPLRNRYDPRQMLTVCTNSPYATRALVDNDIQQFSLGIYDRRADQVSQTGPQYMSMRSAATVSLRDLMGDKSISVDQRICKMSYETSTGTNLVSVSMVLGENYSFEFSVNPPYKIP